MDQNQFKKGQKVKATNRSGLERDGKVVGTRPSARGFFIEVEHAGDAGVAAVKCYRPSQVALVA